MISLGYFPNISFYTDSETEEVTTFPQLCGNNFYRIPIRKPIVYQDGPLGPAETGEGTFYPFILSLKETMALYWTVKSWEIKCSFPSYTDPEGVIRSGGSINEIFVRKFLDLYIDPFSQEFIGTGELVELERMSQLVCRDFDLQSNEGLSPTGPPMPDFIPKVNYSTTVTVTYPDEFGMGPEEVSLGFVISNSSGAQGGEAVDIMTADNISENRTPQEFYYGFHINTSIGRSVKNLLPPNETEEDGEFLTNAILEIPPSGRVIQIPMYTFGGTTSQGSPTISIRPYEYLIVD
jgi:hypothetical protein